MPINIVEDRRRWPELSVGPQAQMSFARFPHFTAEPWTTPSAHHGYDVYLTDLRWRSSKGYDYGPQAKLWWNEHLAIVREEVIPWG